MNEALIHINGVQLNIGQSMALRVAVTGLILRMQEDGLGDRPEAKAMAEAYIARGSEIEQLFTHKID